jgi:hypothetical protein
VGWILVKPVVEASLSIIIFLLFPVIPDGYLTSVFQNALQAAEEKYLG